MSSTSLRLVLASLALAAGFTFTAHGQQASGNISGEAKAGDTVVIEGEATGFHRELSIDEDGKYQVRRVPTGTYVVTVRHADGTDGLQRSVVVRTGSTARVQ
jgi:hypothetical protein